jgi:FkbM family methyltransferase
MEPRTMSLPRAWPEGLVRNRLGAALLRHRFWRNALGRIGPRYILRTIGGLRMLLDLREVLGVSRYILKHGSYDPFVSDLLREWVGPDGHAVDLGANIGYHTLVLASATLGRVTSFEPEPHALWMLRWNVALNDLRNVRVVPKAVGNSRGTLRLYRSAKNSGDHHAYPTEDARDSVEVEVTRTDDEIPEGPMAAVKIDVQGFEERAVRGMEAVLRRSPRVRVVSEFEPKSIRAAGLEPGGYLDFMESLGFRWRVALDEERKLVAMGREELLDLCGPRGYADLVFARE